MSDTNEITMFNAATARLEKVVKLLLTALVLILSGALWAARLEMRVNAVEAENAEHKPRLSAVEIGLAHLEGKLQASSRLKSTTETSVSR